MRTIIGLSIVVFFKITFEILENFGDIEGKTAVIVILMLGVGLCLAQDIKELAK